MTWLSAAVSWLGRLGRGDRMMRTTGEALDATREALPGFPAIDAVVADDGRSALALAADGRIVVVQVIGAKARGREIDWAMLRQTPDGVVAETATRRFGDVLLHGVSALDVRRLGGSEAVAS